MQDVAGALVYEPQGTDTERWVVRSGGGVIATYNTSDLRISLVYRGFCFKYCSATRNRIHLPVYLPAYLPPSPPSTH